jgi:hypothetical protein
MTSIGPHESNEPIFVLINGIPSQVAIRTNIGIVVANTPNKANRALADALGVQLSTMRSNATAGEPQVVVGQDQRSIKVSG